MLLHISQVEGTSLLPLYLPVHSKSRPARLCRLVNQWVTAIEQYLVSATVGKTVVKELDGEDQEPVEKGKVLDVLNLLQRQDIPSLPRKIAQLHTSVTFCKPLKSTRNLRNNGR